MKGRYVILLIPILIGWLYVSYLHINPNNHYKSEMYCSDVKMDCKNFLFFWDCNPNCQFDYKYYPNPYEENNHIGCTNVEEKTEYNNRLNSCFYMLNQTINAVVVCLFLILSCILGSNFYMKNNTRIFELVDNFFTIKINKDDN